MPALRLLALLPILAFTLGACTREDRRAVVETDEFAAPAGHHAALPSKPGTIIRGRVTFEGNAPPKIVLPPAVDPLLCGSQTRIDRSLVVGTAGKGIAWAVVTLEPQDPAALMLTPPPMRAALMQSHCDLEPYITLVSPGSVVRVQSLDEGLHAIDGQTIPPLGKLDLRFEDEGHFPLSCDLHTVSRAWVVVTTAPFRAVTTTSGAFEIRGVPAGAWTLRAWHERLGEVVRPVVTGTSGTAALIENLPLSIPPALDFPRP